MELKGIFHPPDLHRALLLYPFFWIFLSNFFLLQYPFHVSLPPHHHIHSMKMQPYPLREEKLALRNDIEDSYKRRVQKSYVLKECRDKNNTSSKRRCTEAYLPALWELFLTIRSTIFSASVRIGSENLSAS